MYYSTEKPVSRGSFSNSKSSRVFFSLRSIIVPCGYICKRNQTYRIRDRATIIATELAVHRYGERYRERERQPRKWIHIYRIEFFVTCDSSSSSIYDTVRVSSHDSQRCNREKKQSSSRFSARRAHASRKITNNRKREA